MLSGQRKTHKKERLYYSEPIISHFANVEKAKHYVETTDEYAHLLEFERRGDTVNVRMLAASCSFWEFMNTIGMKEIKRNFTNKNLMAFFNGFADYMERTKDIQGALRYKQALQENYQGALQGKHPLPLRLSLCIALEDQEKYLEGVMSSEFIIDGEKEIALTKTDIKEITRQEYERRLSAEITVFQVMNREEREKRGVLDSIEARINQWLNQ